MFPNSWRQDCSLPILAKKIKFHSSIHLPTVFTGFLKIIWHLTLKLNSVSYQTIYQAFIFFNSSIVSFWCFSSHSLLPLRKSGLLVLNSDINVN